MFGDVGVNSGNENDRIIWRRDNSRFFERQYKNTQRSLVHPAREKSTVDHEEVPDNEACGGGSEENRGTYQFGRFAETAHRSTHQALLPAACAIETRSHEGQKGAAGNFDPMGMCPGYDLLISGNDVVH